MNTRHLNTLADYLDGHPAPEQFDMGKAWHEKPTIANNYTGIPADLGALVVTLFAAQKDIEHTQKTGGWTIQLAARLLEIETITAARLFVPKNRNLQDISPVSAARVIRAFTSTGTITW